MGHRHLQTPSEVVGRGRKVTTVAILRFTVATLLGATLVFVYLVEINPPSADLEQYLPVIVITAVACVLYSAIDGIVSLRRRLRPIETWLSEERPATPREQEMVLQLPWHLTVRSFLHWVLVGVVFAVLSWVLGAPLAAVFRILMALISGGATTCAIGFLLFEQAFRPLFARALEGGTPPGRDRRMSITLRLGLSWLLGTAIPIWGILLVLASPRDVTGNLRLSVAFLCLVALAVGGLLLWVAASSVGEPLDEMRRTLAEVEQGHLDVSVPVNDGGEVGRLQSGFNQMVAGLRERQHLEDLFGRHVGTEVARYALDQAAGLVGAENREASALFVDVIGSTALAADQPPEETVAMLNALFDATVRVVTDHGGWVNKFEGDGALCIFGAPGRQPDHAARALGAARALRAEVVDLHGSWPMLDAGVGVSCGRVVAGNVGAEERYEYTIIGDPVNEAARLTEEAKRVPARVLVSKDAVQCAGAPEADHWEVFGEVQLRGRTEPTCAYAPLELTPAG